ncbi:MAG: hypothetical protein OEV73_00275 [Desulfobulbaceae bacterium]|nr:hypothetical protein [Desulfobulbaceae bacterium]
MSGADSIKTAAAGLFAAVIIAAVLGSAYLLLWAAQPACPPELVAGINFKVMP